MLSSCGVSTVASWSSYPVSHFVLTQFPSASFVLQVCCRFYAPWCKACQAVTPGYTALAKKYSNEVKFVQVAITDDNINLHQGLGVPSIPFVHLYYPNGGGLVEEQKFTRKELKSFQRILHDYVVGSCNLLQKRRISSTSDSLDPDETEIVWSTANPYGVCAPRSHDE